MTELEYDKQVFNFISDTLDDFGYDIDDYEYNQVCEICRSENETKCKSLRSLWVKDPTNWQLGWGIYLEVCKHDRCLCNLYCYRENDFGDEVD